MPSTSNSMPDPSLSRRDGFQYFNYSPSMAAAVIFIILFFLSTMLHTYQMLRTRVRFFIAFLLGGYFEIAGYCARAVSCHQTPNWTLVPYIINTLLPLLAPPLFAASIYMELGRIVVILDGQGHNLIRVGWLTKIFVTGDVISLLMQASGGGLMGSKSMDSYNTGSNIIVGGLVVQILCFGFFVISSAIFHFRILRRPTAKSSPSAGIPWQKHMYVLYIASALILVRSIYRLVEYVEGFNGYLISHEAYLYVFDALMMFAVIVTFHVVHPSELNVLLYSGGTVSSGLRFWRVQQEDVALLEPMSPK